MKLTTFAILLLVAISHTTLAQSKKEPFDFKGIRLGITLSEFKQLPIPNTSIFTTSSSYESVMPVKVVCTDMNVNALGISAYASVDEAEKKLDGVNCEYGYETISRINPSNTSGIYRIAPVTVGDYSTFRNTFNFIKVTENSEPILYKILMTFPSNGYQSVSLGLKDRFGKPKVANEAVQNRVGGVFNNTIEQWDNSVSTIVLQRYFGDLDKSGLVYFLKKENALVRKIETEAKKNSM